MMLTKFCQLVSWFPIFVTIRLVFFTRPGCRQGIGQELEQDLGQELGQSLLGLWAQGA